MASWQDGPEYAPAQRPFAFRDVVAPGLDQIGAAPAVSVLEDRPEPPPASFQDAPHPDLIDLVEHRRPHRDPTTAFTSAPTGSGGRTGAWGATHTSRNQRRVAPGTSIAHEVDPFAGTEPAPSERLRQDAAAISGRMPRHSFTTDPEVRALLTPMLTMLGIGVALGIFVPLAALLTLLLAFLYSGYASDRIGQPLSRFWVWVLPAIFVLGLVWNPKQELWPSVGLVSLLASLVMIAVVLVHPFPEPSVPETGTPGAGEHPSGTDPRPR